MNLLSNLASNPKTVKRMKQYNIEGVILHLLAHNQGNVDIGISPKLTLCPFSVINKCSTACLVNQGRGRMASVYAGRLRKTKLFWKDRKEFERQVRQELHNLVVRANKKGLRAVARLDGTSNLGLASKLYRDFPAIQFYDYTKDVRRARRWLKDKPPNYNLTFSRGAGNDKQAKELLSEGANVAVVFRLRKGKPFPYKWNGYSVIDGDEDDYRFLDPKGVVVGLRSKGTAYYDTTGFVEEV